MMPTCESREKKKKHMINDGSRCRDPFFVLNAVSHTRKSSRSRLASDPDCYITCNFEVILESK